MTRRINRLKKRAGRNPGADKLAEHERIEQLFADGGVGSSQGMGRLAAVRFTAHEQADEQSAPGE